MKTTKYIISLALAALSFTTSAQAQNDESSITITDAQGKEQEIELPGAMTQELDSLMQLYNSRMYLQPDSDCNLPDNNPVYDAETYKARLKRLPTVIEMPYNDIVQKFIDRYTNDLRRSVAYMLGAQNFYMPEFEEALETYNLPLELKYLPVIESALNPKAVSHAGAVGLWQFMLRTAKRYGLEVNSYVDERRDIVKASYAAARYLKDLYGIFGDWNLVIAAYNCGPTKINKAIHRCKGERDYWKIYPLLPKETRGYVPAFIAANYVMNYYCEHNICPLLTELPSRTDTIMVNRNVHFEQIAHALGIGLDQLQDLNPQYRRNIVNGDSKLSPLRLPADLVTAFIDNQDSIYAFNPKNYRPKRTEVQVEDNATYVVRNNKVERIANPVSDNTSAPIVITNDDDSGDETVETPPKVNRSKSRSTMSRSKRSGRNTKKKSKRTRSKNVSIRQGDTLSEIAERNNTTVSKLRKLNNIKGNNIRAGKKIRVK